MNRVAELIKRGYFIQNTDLIRSLSDDDFNMLLSSLPKTSVPKILTNNEILQLLNKKEKQKRFIIKISEISQKSKLNILDVLNILKERYFFLSSIIKKKISFFNLISINKISKKYKSFSIIGCVYDIKGNRITLDDFSSKIDIYISNNEAIKFINKDCVIGVRCRWENDVIISDEIIFPEFDKKIDRKLKDDENSFEEIEIEIFRNNFDVNKFLNLENKKIILVLNKENKIINNNIVYLNFDLPIHRLYINDFFILIIDKLRINFEFERFFKQRLIESEIEKTLAFGADIFLIKDQPNLIIFINSELDKLEEKYGIFTLYLKNETTHFKINFRDMTLNIF